MRFLIIQPSWDHSEILSSLLYYIKKSNNTLKIIYDWSHPEGNYLDYYCQLFGFDDNVKINYKSPKYHVNNFVNAHKIIFVDEIHLKKFMSKNIYKKLAHKIYTFNHLTKQHDYNICNIFLGKVPFKRCIMKNKVLFNNYYNPSHNIKYIPNKRKKYLIVGNPSQRRVSFLKRLKYTDIDIYFVIRRDIDYDNNNVHFIKDLPTNELINLIQQVDFIITLFRKDSVYHYDRISGIVPFAISFGKPLITDIDYIKIANFSDLPCVRYRNVFTNFNRIINNTRNLKNNEYKKLVNDIIKYRDIKITEQYLNFSLLFN